MEVKEGDVVLCEFYFSSLKKFKKRPVLVFKDNLPYNDFVAIAISSKIKNLKKDEVILQKKDFVEGSIPKKSKIMIRKTFIVSKDIILKKYGAISKDYLKIFHKKFCSYFNCIAED